MNPPFFWQQPDQSGQWEMAPPPLIGTLCYRHFLLHIHCFFSLFFLISILHLPDWISLDLATASVWHDNTGNRFRLDENHTSRQVSGAVLGPVG